MGIVSTLASGTARRWTALISGGAYAFMAVLVLLLRPWVRPDIACPGTWLTAPVCDVDAGEPLALAALGVLAVVAACGASLVVAALAGPLIHLLAGAGLPLRGPLGALVRLRLRQRVAVKHRLTALADDPSQGPRAARARQRLRRRPVRDATVSPTRVGDTFAAMGERVLGRHRLDVHLCWPLFQQIFDEPARRDLDQASELVLGRARNLIWAGLTAAASLGLAFLDRVHDRPAALVTLLAVLVGTLLLAGLGQGADVYADTVEAAVLRHRDALYAAAAWPLPAGTVDETRTGGELSAYLSRLGRAPLDVTFERPPPEQEGPTP